MVFFQKNTPPPNKRETFTIKDYRGGLNNRHIHAGLLDDTEASDLLNLAFADEVLYEKRKGAILDKPLTGFGDVTLLDTYRSYTDAPMQVEGGLTKLQINDIELAGYNATNMQGMNHMGHYFFTQGTDLIVYGKFPTSETAYEKVLGTPVNDYVVMKVVNPPAGYVQNDNTHTQGNTVYDYNNNWVWYEPCQLEMEDTYKGANVIPESSRFIVSHNGRLFLSGNAEDDDNVFITDIHNPFYFPVSLPLQVPPNSDEIVGMIVYDNAVVVSRKDDVYAIRGLTNNPSLDIEMFRLFRLNVHTGFANVRSVNVVHSHLFYVGHDGNVYAMNAIRDDERVLSSQLINKTIDLFKEPISLTKDQIRNSFSVFHDDMWYVGFNNVDMVLVYSYRRRAWTLYRGLGAKAFHIKSDTLHWGMNDGIGKHAENFYDYGKPFECRWASKVFDMGDANAFKYFREIFLVSHVFDNYNSDIRVKFEIDHVDVNSDVVVKNAIAKYGISKWGDRFITRNINYSFPIIVGRRGRTIRIILSNSWDIDNTVWALDDLNTITGTKHNETLAYVESLDEYYVWKLEGWEKKENIDLDQPMRVYQVNGDYEMRGKR
jgi:hypothetical protein